MRHISTIAVLLAATAPLALARGAVGQQNACIADWSVAAPIVKKESPALQFLETAACRMKHLQTE